MLGKVKNLHVWNMRDVRARVVFLWERSSVAVLKRVVVEVEFLMLQSEISQSSRRHEISFYITGTFASSLADDDVLIFELRLQPLLFVLFIGIESF